MAYKQKNYFEFRDSLPKGEPDKVIKGKHFDEEFKAIEDAFTKVTDDIEIDGKPLSELLNEKADQVDLEQEIQDRIEGDKLLQDQIDALEPYDDTQIKQDLSDLDDKIEKEITDRGEADKNLQDQIDVLDRDKADDADLQQEIKDREEGDKALNNRIDNLKVDDLADTKATAPAKDEFLIYDGTDWVAEKFHIDTELQFKGGISVPNDPAPAAEDGDLYINNEEGIAGASWTGIAGRQINPANAVGWSSTNARWYMLGDIATSAVTEIREGTAIRVDATEASRPIVSVDLKELGKDFAPVDGAYVYSDQANACTADFTIDCQKTAITGQSVSSATVEGEYFTARLDDSSFNIQSSFVFNNRSGAALSIDGSGEGITAPKIKKLNGTANQLLCADGSVVDKANVGSPTDLSNYYTKTESNTLFDNYSHWRVQTSKDGQVSTVANIASNGLINFESGDGITVSHPSNNVIRIEADFSAQYTLPLANDGTRGGVQIGYGENGKNYAVKLSGEKMYVTVPWTDTQNPNYSLPLAANGTRGGVQVGYTTSGKNYAVQLSGEKMYVNVPWTDTTTDLTGYATESWVTTNHYKKTETKKNVVMTEAAYNALGTKDAETVYFLT